MSAFFLGSQTVEDVTFLKVSGTIDEDKARHAAELAMKKYCSALASLDPTIPVTFDLETTPG